MGGRPLKKSPNQVRVGTFSSLVQQDHPVSPSSNRFICSPRKRKNLNLRMSLSSPISDNSGRHDIQLEQMGSNLSISSDQSNTELPSKTSSFSGERPVHRPPPSIRTMVAGVCRKLQNPLYKHRRIPIRTRKKSIINRSDVAQLPRVQVLTRLYARKFSPAVAQTLIHAHRGSASSQYEHTWKDFQGWLTANPNKPILKVTIIQYLNYLTTSRKLNPKTVLVYRNALHLPLLHGFNISTKDSEFFLLARAQFIQNPPLQRIIPHWNPNKVRSMLEQPQYLNSHISPNHLLMKTLFLTALTTGNRVSELAAFSQGAIMF